MARPKADALKPPKYRLHKRSGLAIVTLFGKDHYLGPRGNEEGKNVYKRLIGEWLSTGGSMPTAVAATDTEADEGITVSELLAVFMTHPKARYRRDGRAISEVHCYRSALRPLKMLYGVTPAAKFGPLALGNVRNEMVAAVWARTSVNRQVARLRHVFRWGVARDVS